MCGLVGMAGNLNGQHDRVLKTLLILDSLRGEDSTGVAFVNKFTSNVTLAKVVGDPFALFYDNKYAKGLSGVNKVIIGHNRYATSGGINRNTSHPFEFDTLIGAHNGTISSRYRLDDDKDFKVDSQALYHNIEKNGLRNTIEKLGGLNNAWSLVWWDKTASTLNFLRNKERPLFMCRSEDKEVLYWASEAWMLEVALDRAQLKYGNIFSTDVDMHYSVHINDKGVMSKPHVERIAAKEFITTYTGGQSGKPPFIHPAQNKPVVNNIVQLPATQDKTLAVSGVAAPQKKPDGSTSQCDIFYANAKDRTLEILCARVDGNGNKYLALFDPKKEAYDIRLYPRKEDADLFDLLGSDIICNISCYDHSDKKALRGYYKADPWGVKRVEEDKYAVNKVLQQELKEALAADDDLFQLMDHRGKLITINEFKQQYALCGWCDAPIQPLDHHRFTTSGDCLCPECANNKEVQQYVSII